MPPLSPIPWNTFGRPTANSLVDRYVADQLVDSLTVAMKLGSGENGYLDNTNHSPSPPAPPSTPSTPTSQICIKSEYPPPASMQIKNEFQQLPVLTENEYSTVAGGVRIKSEYQAPTTIQIKSEYPQSIVRIKSEYPQSTVRIKSEYSLYDACTAPYADRHQDFGYQSQPSSPTTVGTMVSSPSQPCTSPQLDPFPSVSKTVSSAEAYRYLLHQQQLQQQQHLERAGLKDPQVGLTSNAHLMMGHLTFNNTLPYDLDLNTLQGGLECDVDQVIRHELSVDGELDFNFDPLAAAAAAAHANSMSSRPWVH